MLDSHIFICGHSVGEGGGSKGRGCFESYVLLLAVVCADKINIKSRMLKHGHGCVYMSSGTYAAMADVTKFYQLLKVMSKKAENIRKTSQADVSLFIRRGRRWYSIRERPVSSSFVPERVEGPSKNSSRVRKERFKSQRNSFMKKAYKLYKCKASVHVVFLRNGQYYEQNYQYCEVGLPNIPTTTYG